MNAYPSGHQPSRALVAVLSTVAGVVLVVVLAFVLPKNAAVILIDPGFSLYPLSIQNITWVFFAIGVGELWLRIRYGGAEMAQLKFSPLPTDDRMLRVGDLPEIHQAIRQNPGAEAYFLPRLIQSVVQTFQSSESIGQANTLLNSNLDLYLHEIDLRYNMLRYIMWLLPTIGFIGTVVGIASALSFAGTASLEDPSILETVTGKLGTAFNTTLLALVLSAFLVLGMHIAQGREEGALNKAGQHCLDRLINRLYER